MAVALPRSRSPRILPRPFWAATAGYVDRPQAAMHPVIGRERRRVRPVIAPPPLRATAGDPTPIMQVKVRTWAKSRVSIETWEL